jgi:hypothetical protein
MHSEAISNSCAVTVSLMHIAAANTTQLQLVAYYERAGQDHRNAEADMQLPAKQRPIKRKKLSDDAIKLITNNPHKFPNIAARIAAEAAAAAAANNTTDETTA